MNRKAVLAGSFDPFTLAHFDIVQKASSLFDSVTVLVGVNRRKHPLLPLERRVHLIERALEAMPNVSVDSFEGLTVDYLEKVGANFLVRGIRSAFEFDAERNLAWNNQLLNSRVETVFLPVAPEYASISSSVVREILSFGGDVSKMIPASILNDLRNGDLSDVRFETI